MIRQHIVAYCMASSLAALMLDPAAGAEINSRGGARTRHRRRRRLPSAPNWAAFSRSRPIGQCS
jgi:hypothetical protein